MAKKQYQKTSKHFGTDPLYQKLIYVIQHTQSNKKAAKRLSISPSTLSRWKAFGIPDRTIQKKKYSQKINRVSSGLKSSIEKLPTEQRAEPRALFYYRWFGGVRVKYWLVDGLPYDEMLYILLKECNKDYYSSFRIRFEINVDFQGFYDGEDFTSKDDFDNLDNKEKRAIRQNGSWLDVSAGHIISTKLFALTPGFCHPDEFEESLYRYYGMEFVNILELIFTEQRRDENNQLIDFYNLP